MVPVVNGGLRLGENTSDDGFTGDLVVSEELQEASRRTFLANAENTALRECDDLFEQEFLASKKCLAPEDDFIIML